MVLFRESAKTACFCSFANPQQSQLQIENLLSKYLYLGYMHLGLVAPITAFSMESCGGSRRGGGRVGWRVGWRWGEGWGVVGHFDLQKGGKEREVSKWAGGEPISTLHA